MNWRAVSKVDARKFSCKSGAADGLAGDDEHEAGCSLISFSNRLYVNLPSGEGDGGSSNYKPPKKTQLQKSFGDGKGSSWRPPPPPKSTNRAGYPAKKQLGWGFDDAAVGKEMEAAVKSSPANSFSDIHE
jgi:hypothetical protein